ncbi:hypothetical protein GGS23DRAFT_597327 [Durotheca rogersii]|uniref:uncharacterized protein n=1 Tax=Durotheca rogersii TaxID=419775 RepID=UPI0022201FAC|nr:uncharacterized protein GGS23DRAFT_597327 [Durotheca rogersii]KAI5862524.1 hypothetical protein GGS23DRAFT_597327 [Durotheca rogersii]
MIERFVLLGIGLTLIGLRLYVRARVVGWRGLWVDDYMMIVVAMVYAALTAGCYFLLVVYRGLANNGLTPEQRAALEPGGLEYAQRIGGSKATIYCRILYTVVCWMTKGAMLAFCLRLTERFGKYEKRIRAGFVILVVSWVADFLITMLSCRPFHDYWQIWPDPGEMCQPALSPYSVYGTMGLNVATSAYVFWVPLPVLWMAGLQLWKKLGLVVLVLGNAFVMAIAILCGARVASRAGPDAFEAGAWAQRVAFAAVLTSNLPLLFPLVSRRLERLQRARADAARRAHDPRPSPAKRPRRASCAAAAAAAPKIDYESIGESAARGRGAADRCPLDADDADGIAMLLSPPPRAHARGPRSIEWMV